MDPNVRWLRRFVLANALARVGMETAMVGGVVATVVLALREPVLWAVALSLLTMLVFPVVRLGSAIMLNPVDARYLAGWGDPVDDLREAGVDAPSEAALEVELSRAGFTPLTRFESAAGGLDVYWARSGLVVAVVDRAGTSTTDSPVDSTVDVVTRMEDGRMVVTSAGFLPPVGDTIINRCRGRQGRPPEPSELFQAHADCLAGLGRSGLRPVTSDQRLALEQLRAEWQAWQQLGPFIGPLAATGVGRRHPFRLEVEVSADLVLRRTLTGIAGRADRQPTVASAPAPALRTVS